ncbi:unnamed protein product [Bathycoccus prasinos]
MKISTAFSTPAFTSFISSSRRRRPRRTTTTKSSSFDDDADACYNLDELFDDDRPSNRKALFDVSKKAQKKKKDESETMMMSMSSSTRRSLEVEVPSVMKSKAAILAEEMYEGKEERMNEEEKELWEGEDLEDQDLMRKVVKGVDGILDGVEKETRQNFLVKGTWETFKRGERIAKNPSVQKGAKIVQKVSVETVKVATPIVAKAAATGIKEGGKLAFKVALGAKNMGDERRQKKQAKKIVEKKSNGITPTWKKNEGVFKSGKVPFSSFGRRNEKEEEEEEEEEENENNVFKSLFGGGKKKEQPPPPPKKKRTDIFGRERE